MFQIVVTIFFSTNTDEVFNLVLLATLYFIQKPSSDFIHQVKSKYFFLKLKYLNKRRTKPPLDWMANTNFVDLKTCK